MRRNMSPQLTSHQSSQRWKCFLASFASNPLLPHVNSYLKWNFQMFHPNLILSRWQRQAWWFSKQHHCYISWPLQPGRSVGVPCVYMLVISLYQGEMANQGGTMIDRSLYVSTELVTVTRTCRTNFDSSQIDSMHACRAKVFYKGDMIMSVCSGGHSACPCQWSLQVQTEYYRLIFPLFHALKYDGNYFAMPLCPHKAKVIIEIWY